MKAAAAAATTAEATSTVTIAAAAQNLAHAVTANVEEIHSKHHSGAHGSVSMFALTAKDAGMYLVNSNFILEEQKEDKDQSITTQALIALVLQKISGVLHLDWAQTICSAKTGTLKVLLTTYTGCLMGAATTYTGTQVLYA